MVRHVLGVEVIYQMLHSEEEWSQRTVAKNAPKKEGCAEVVSRHNLCHSLNPLNPLKTTDIVYNRNVCINTCTSASIYP